MNDVVVLHGVTLADVQAALVGSKIGMRLVDGTGHVAVLHAETRQRPQVSSLPSLLQPQAE